MPDQSSPAELAEAERWLARLGVDAHNHTRAMARAISTEYDRRGSALECEQKTSAGLKRHLVAEQARLRSKLAEVRGQRDAARREMARVDTLATQVIRLEEELVAARFEADRLREVIAHGSKAMDGLRVEFEQTRAERDQLRAQLVKVRQAADESPDVSYEQLLTGLRRLVEIADQAGAADEAAVRWENQAGKLRIERDLLRSQRQAALDLCAAVTARRGAGALGVAAEIRRALGETE